MKKLIYVILALMAGCQGGAFAQTYNAAYVKSLYAKYPTVKSSLCPACKLWVNPYYKSIADTQKHMPLITYAYYKASDIAHVNSLAIERAPKNGSKQSAIFGAWHSLPGQPNEAGVYTAANVAVKKLDKNDEIAKGHCQAWILNAYNYDACILSDTYTFNAACEDQGQNVGTEINTENITRQLLGHVDVEVWCGTFGSQGTFTDGKVTDTYPAYYWKILKYGGTKICYWMPNLKTETQAETPDRIVTYQQLVKNLGFDPENTLK